MSDFTDSVPVYSAVYAFLGIADRTRIPFRHYPNVPIPDYNRCVQDVYTETARVLINSHKELSLLSHVEEHSTRRIEGLPSWVPDLSVPVDPYPLRFRGSSVWRASHDHYWISDRPRMAQGLLDVHGYMLGYVDRTALLLNESLDRSASWASIVSLTLSLDLPYPSTKMSGSIPSRIEILWRTLTTNMYAHTYPAPHEVGSLFVDYIINLRIRHRLMQWSSRDSFQPNHAPLSDYLPRVADTAESRAFRFALLPHSIQRTPNIYGREHVQRVVLAYRSRPTTARARSEWREDEAGVRDKRWLYGHWTTVASRRR